MIRACIDLHGVRACLLFPRVVLAQEDKGLDNVRFREIDDT